MRALDQRTILEPVRRHVHQKEVGYVMTKMDFGGVFVAPTGAGRRARAIAPASGTAPR